MNVESGAGGAASFTDSMYTDVGGQIVDKQQAFNSDIVMKVRKISKIVLNIYSAYLKCFTFFPFV